MTDRNAVASRLDEHRLIKTLYRQGCACGDWTSNSPDSFELHLADVVLYYFPALVDHSAQRWDEGFTQAVIDLCPPDFSAVERLEWTIDHPPRGNPYNDSN